MGPVRLGPWRTTSGVCVPSKSEAGEGLGPELVGVSHCTFSPDTLLGAAPWEPGAGLAP